MILPDNETKLDFLNNQAIAKTIVSIIRDSKESVSVGVHGDWGAGKSSILAMVEAEISDVVEKTKKDEKPFKADTIRFNGWQHQGFEDSKVALMSAIVSQLVKNAEKHPIKEGARSFKEIAKNLWKNINWLSVAKQAGSIGFSLATGTVPLTILSNVFEILKGHVDSKEHVEEAIGTIGAFLKKGAVTEDTSSFNEFNEFRKSFKELLDAAQIEKLVVIIDDLDRCLPTVAIETLEAVRMFMFMEETAFVIGADEVMIRYAVKKHFPDMERENRLRIGDDFADKYLEKLIQVPFRIPVLGPVESHLYTMLLMVGSEKRIPEKAYKQLVDAVLDRLKKPWDITPFGIADVRAAIGEEHYGCITDKAQIAIQISPILYQYSRGNPRVIKRFINMLLLRYAIAENRGYGDAIDLKVLAKLMLAEKKWPSLYENIALHLINGRSPELALLEKQYTIPLNEMPIAVEHEDCKKDKEKTNDIVKKATKQKEKAPITQEKYEWISSEEYKPWILSEPLLKDKDLRPYYVACKEKIDFFGRIESDEALREVVDILMKDEAVVVGATDRIKGLSEENATKAFEIVVANVSSVGDLTYAPAGFAGLKKLTEIHPYLRKSLIDFVCALPPNKVGEWIVTGWEYAIPKGCEERKLLDEYLMRLKESGSGFVQVALKFKGV